MTRHLTPRLETVGMDSLIVRLFESIDQANMPWVLAADQALRDTFNDTLIDLMPSYTTLLVNYDIRRLGLEEARRLVRKALEDLMPVAATLSVPC